jgi:multidrug efflux pump subunit AcrA (membrane-fusion protein)
VPEKPLYPVQRGEVIETFEFTGRVSPVVEEQLVYQTSGRVGDVNVKSDEWVETGDILAELEVSDLKDQLAQAQAALDSILSQHAQRVADAEAALRGTEWNLAITQARDPGPKITVAEVALTRAQTALEDAQATGQDIPEAELDAKVAQAIYDEALQARHVFSYTVQLQEQEVDLAEMRLQRLDTALDVEEMRLAVERLNAQLANARLIAPFDGQVLAVAIRKGQEIDAFEPAMILIDPGELEIRAELSETDLELLVEDMQVTASPPGKPAEQMQGHILSLPYPYGTGDQGIAGTRVVLDSSAIEDDFDLGDRLEILVILEHKDDVLWLPIQALRNFEGRNFVVVQEGATQIRKDVKLGIEGEGRVEITEGLVEGEVIIGQ